MIALNGHFPLNNALIQHTLGVSGNHLCICGYRGTCLQELDKPLLISNHGRQACWLVFPRLTIQATTCYAVLQAAFASIGGMKEKCSMAASPPTRTRVFISYSPANAEHLKRLHIHLDRKSTRLNSSHIPLS